MSEIEEKDSLSFLDIAFSCLSNKFLKSVYRKPIFSCVFMVESFIPDMYKRVFIKNLLHRSFRLCSNYENFHREIETLNYSNTIFILKTS